MKMRAKKITLEEEGGLFMIINLLKMCEVW